MIINATNIGAKISGIGRYSLSLSGYLLENWDYPFQIYINRQAASHFPELNQKIKLVSRYISPDYRFKGHLLRLLWTHKLCLLNQKTTVFNTSPLEGALYYKRQIIMVHDLIPLFYPRFHKKQYPYFKSVLPKILKTCIRILTVSNHTKERIIEFYRIPQEKISVIHNGINASVFQEDYGHGSNTGDPAYILFVGRLSPLKNIEGLIRAFELVAHQHNLRLKLTGDQRELDFEIGEKTRERIDFLETVSDRQLAKLYRNALALILPSFHEGFGLPPLEAMACGCPVVVSRVTSLPEVCGDAAFYVDPGDIESIAEGIRKVATDEALRKSLIQKGLKRARRFTWEKSAREHIRIFEEVLGGQQGRS